MSDKTVWTLEQWDKAVGQVYRRELTAKKTFNIFESEGVIAMQCELNEAVELLKAATPQDWIGQIEWRRKKRAWLERNAPKEQG